MKKASTKKGREKKETNHKNASKWARFGAHLIPTKYEEEEEEEEKIWNNGKKIKTYACSVITRWQRNKGRTIATCYLFIISHRNTMEEANRKQTKESKQKKEKKNSSTSHEIGNGWQKQSARLHKCRNILHRCICFYIASNSKKDKTHTHTNHGSGIPKKRPKNIGNGCAQAQTNKRLKNAHLKKINGISLCVRFKIFI